MEEDDLVPNVVINEVLASTTGTDSEYIELFGTPGASLAGLSFVSVEANDIASQGEFDFRFDFADDVVLGDNGFLLIANATAQATYGVTGNLELDVGALENSSATYALVQTASLSGSAVTGAEIVIDAVTNIGDDTSATFFDAPVVGPDGSFFPAGVGRVADGVDTDSADDWEVLNFFNDSPPNTPTAGTGLDGGGPIGEGSIDDDPTLISAIQGSGDASDLVGQTVVVEAIVTGDYQNGDDDSFRDLGGFFLMEEGADQDADAATSEGLFVFEGNDDTLSDVSAGDQVRVLGTVVERFGKTSIEVQEIRIEEAEAVDPLSLAVSTTLPDADGREALEGMLVTIEEALTFSESFDYEAFGEALFTTDGPVFQFSQLNTPDVAGNTAYQEEVADRSITIDDGTNGGRADFSPITLPDGRVITAPDDFYMGQSVDDLTAIFDFDFGEYRLRLPEDVFFDLDDSSNPVTTEPEDVGSAYKVASLNVLNYFTTIDGLTDNGNDPRGADSIEELARQTDKLVETILGMESDVIGLIEIENDFAGTEFAIQTLVGEINAELGSDDWAFVDPGTEFVGDDAIAVAFIYDTTTTGLVGDAAILDTDAFLDPLGTGTGGDEFNRAALAQTFTDLESGGNFTAAVNHFKSKGSLTGAPEDVDQGDGAGNNNATRTAASQELAAWLETDPTGSDDEDVLILGDLNAYARETPITALEDAGYTNLASAFEGDDVASFRFSGQIGTLDYALANEALNGQVTGATTWNTNSDTPVIFDYNLDGTFTSQDRPTDQGLFDGESPLRASDHDPVIVGLSLDDDSDEPVDGRLLVLGTQDSDRINGTEADERFELLGGPIDGVRGEGGSDVFAFADQEGVRDSLRVLDFDTSDDFLDLGGAEISSTSTTPNGLTIRIEGADRDYIYLAGVTDIADVMLGDGGGDVEPPLPVILGEAGINDRITGTDAAEIINPLGGAIDAVRGGGGGDIFAFTDTPELRDSLRILDYEVGSDSIDLAGAVISSSTAFDAGLYIRIENADRDAIFVSDVFDIEEITFLNDDILIAV